ncbi:MULTISPECIES: DUF1003 domain-containing protein [unclassified Sphingomonas]|uniref:DUF1003 domain-containing protein n=1 Tax=unclassified Sphingomonas TaxID=196159 RepID=UPI00226AEB8F|nr:MULTISPECIES: DUF1003 domain-containing protein [unclassified Sphingomonas]
MADHEEATVDQLAKLYDRHDQRTTRVQRLANRVTSALGKPMALVVIFGIATAWIIGNYIARATGSTALEEFPFPDLGFIATIGALLVALLILTTQRHEEELAESRAQLTLHIAMLSERKIAKVIQLLEEQRRDNPMLPSRVDHEAAEMAQPSDHDSTLGMLDDVADQRRSFTDE